MVQGGGGGGKFQIDVNEEGVCGDSSLPERVYYSACSSVFESDKRSQNLDHYNKYVTILSQKTTDEFLIIHEPLS